jgi:diguanylate cyclase (GGDEF)-like protein
MLFVYPLITVVLGSVRLEGVVVWPIDIITYLIIILLHIVFSRYIQLAKENERLLGIEKAANQLLEQRVAQQIEAITRLACLDELTGLSNRKHLLKTLEEKFNTLPLHDTLAVIVMNVDRFKTINDHFGPEAADAMLVELAHRLREWVGEDSLVARMGGDEYGLLLSGNRTEAELTEYCDDLTKLFNRPVSLAGNRLEVTVSIGAALRTADLPDGRQLLQNAEIALHQAKSQGYNHRQLFDPLMANAALSEGRVELLLRQADIEQDFELFYQPQFTLPDRRLVGAEALCRWHHSQLGFIAPAVFIPVAEKIGFIGKLGAWVLQEAARQAAEWATRRTTPIRVGVNISPVQLGNETFADDLTAIAQAAGTSPSLLDLEITESMMLRDTEKFRHELYRLKKLGFSLSIDDFGSGYASVAYLDKYPLNRMKIDKSLIDGLLVRGGTGYTIVRSIIGMAQSLGIETIAEGVERDEQLSQLIALGCNQVQGFLTGRPVPAAEFERLFLYL